MTTVDALERQGAALLEQGMFLWQQGHRTEALDVTRQAVDKFQELAQADTARSHQFGAALNNYGAMLEEAGDHDTAVPVLERAVRIRRVFAQFGDDYQADLAMSLANLGRAHASPLQPLVEAATIYRDLVARGHDGYKLSLAQTLNSVGNARGLVPEASDDFARAAATLRTLDPATNDEVALQLAATLASRCGILLHVGDATTAETNATEALTLFRRLAAANPTASTRS